ncbi:hypothetical protein [Pseudochrobactrum asaccharolyticum]|uniref:hypothetical protein n=1 Tax=Pseudochrobactrum asaccharolyticum TaxID=354351 RepID=UPI0040424B5B
MKAGACIIFFILHVMQIIMIFILLKDYSFVDPALYETISSQKSKDVFHIAMQIGRFDLLTSLLAVISIILALSAIFGFMEIRSKAGRIAHDAAKDEATKVAKDVAEDVATKAVVDVVTRLMPSYIDINNHEYADYGKAAGGENGHAK